MLEAPPPFPPRRSGDQRRPGSLYHLGVAVTAGPLLGAGGRRGGGGGGGRRAGGGDVELVVVVVRLRGALRVTAGQEVGARPGHARFLFGDGAAHLLPGNHRRSGVCVCV